MYKKGEMIRRNDFKNYTDFDLFSWNHFEEEYYDDTLIIFW